MKSVFWRAYDLQAKGSCLPLTGSEAMPSIGHVLFCCAPILRGTSRISASISWIVMNGMPRLQMTCRSGCDFFISSMR